MDPWQALVPVVIPCVVALRKAWQGSAEFVKYPSGVFHSYLHHHHHTPVNIPSLIPLILPSFSLEGFRFDHLHSL
ncbi:hypothetical protein HOY82DRAFT_316514 [Tuber indicum]|nr:hypothetical protein HOY82DRAFT_316514 [Tuber indicum]